MREKVVVVVLFLNNHEVTCDCLESVMTSRYENFEVIAVNNGPPDEGLERLREGFPAVTFISTGSNLGYAGGNNAGIDLAMRSGAGFVWVLNNDTTVDPDALECLVEAAARYPDAGIFNPKTYYHSHPDRLVFGDIEWKKWKSNPKTIGQDQADHGQFDYPHEMEAADGASLFIRSSLIREIGAFDEWFFCYYEDSDFSLRAREHGWKIRFVPGARIRHRVGYTSVTESPLTSYYGKRNSMRCALNNYPAYLPVVFTLGIIKHVARNVSLGRYDHLRMGLRGYRDFFLNRGGALHEH